MASGSYIASYRLLMKRKIIPAGQRFESKISKSESGCWIWKGSYLKTGYGVFHIVNGSEKKHVRANRYSWMHFRREDPKEALVLHKCDNKACVNPEHLYLGDKRQNTKDAIERGQHKTGEHCSNWICMDGLLDRIRDLRRMGTTVKDVCVHLRISISSYHRWRLAGLI